MTGRKYQIALLTATSILAFSPLEEAVAQDVVMRRPIPIAKTSGNAGWQTTPFVIVDATGNVIPESSACGNYQMRREVWCQDQDGKVTDPYFCSTKPKPNETQNQFFDAGCSYEWKTNDWSDPGNSCTFTEAQTRSVTCIRTLDGLAVSDSFCSETKPETSREVVDLSSCTYSWKSTAFVDPGASCTEAEIQNRTATCYRDLDDAQVDASECNAASKPSETQAVKDITGCSYSWQAGTFVDPGDSCTKNEVQTRTVVCTISLDGSVVGDANCNPSTKPELTQAVEDYKSCEYTATQWSEWAFDSTCSASATKTRTAKCQRSNDGGEIVADSECTSRGIELTQTATEANYSTCTNNWVASEWADPGPACTASEIQTRSVTCNRDLDGALQPDAACNAATKPNMSQVVADYSSCTFSPVNWSAWSYNSTCSANATRTRTAQCERQDGTIVSDSACAAQGVSLTQSETVAIYDSCSYSWTTGSWVDPGNSCTASETQTRSIGCKRDLDGAIVANSLCNVATKPADSQTQSDYSGCTFSWVIGSWTDPGASCTASETQTRSVTCRRSDGTNVGDANCASPTPTSTQIVSDYSGCTYSTSSTETACSNGSKTVSYTCTRSDGTGVAVSNCGLPSATSVQNCNSYAWSADAWSGWGSCVAPGTQSRTRNVVCQQTNGSTVTTVSDGLCSSSGTKPSTTENQSCTYYTYGWATSGWSNYDNTCSSSATRTRNVTCNRYPDNISVSESNCSGQKPSSSETTAVYSGCSYATSSTETSCSAGYKTVSYGCTRSDGAPADLSSCGIGSATSIQACTSYAWNVGGWSGWGACVAPGTQSRTRNVFCEATTGSSKTSVSDGYCGGSKPTSSESQSCSYYSYSWVTGSWGGWSTGCGSATRNRSVWCYRNPDNQLMDPDQSQCTATAGAKPTSQESAYNIYSCGYTPSYGSWSACNNGTQTRSMTSCQRSDGANVSTTDCVNAGYTATQSQSCAVALNSAWCQNQAQTVWNGQTFNYLSVDPTNPTSYTLVPNQNYPAGLVFGGTNYFTSASWAYQEINGSKMCQAVIPAFNMICTTGVTESGQTNARSCSNIPAAPF